MMYPNIIFVSAVNLFFKIYSIAVLKINIIIFPKNSLCDLTDIMWHFAKVRT